MFGSNYYCLVAGLREYTLDTDTKGFDARAIIDEILEGVSSADAASIRLLYGYYDCENLISLRNGRSAFNPLGNLSHELIERQMQSPSMLPAKVAAVVCAFTKSESDEDDEDQSVDTNLRFETALLDAYYDECRRSESMFLRRWSEFDRTLRNISAAATARFAGRPVDDVTVGGGDIVNQIRHSSATDFGLRGELSYIDAVIAAVNDEGNLLEKEHKIDLVRWTEADELSTFDYFNINAILAYMVKVNIVARWMRLDERQGRAMFERLLAELDAKEMINKQ